MRIRWYGHACFLLESGQGTRILTDPFDPQVGYAFPSVGVDLVTVSHQHYDHNNYQAVAGSPQVVIGPMVMEMKDVLVQGFPSFHDAARGAQRGANTIFVYTIDGLRVCHLGDLGHTLTAAQAEPIKPVDILLVPVGGVYTIDAAGAVEVVKALAPRVVIPMHYRTPALTFELAGVDAFLALMGGQAEKKSGAYEMTKEGLPGQTTVVVLDYPVA